MTELIPNPHLSVVIPVFERNEELLLCLKALEKQTLSANAFEVLVVVNDNFYPRPLGDLNLRLRQLHYPRPGAYGARNFGVRHSIGDVIAFTDSDCIPDKDWLLNGMKCMASGVDRVAGDILVFSRRTPPNLAERTQLAFAFDAKKDFETRSHAATANTFIRRSSFLEVGYFRDDLYSGGDVEWSSRAQIKNLTLVFCESSFVWHPARDSVGSLIRHRRRIAGAAEKLRESADGRQIIRKTLFRRRGVIRIIREIEAGWGSKIAVLVVAAFLYLVQVIWTLMFRMRLANPPRD